MENPSQLNKDYINFSLRTLYGITIADELAMQLCIMKKSNYTHNGMSYLIARGFKFYYASLKSAITEKDIWIFRHSIHFQKLRKWINEDL